MIDFLQARTNMVDGQISTSGVVDPKILESFGTIPRELFIPEKLQSISYMDKDIALGQGRFLLEPSVYAKMIQAVNLVATDIILDIGSATGYSSAILAPIVTTIIALENNKRQMDKSVRLWDQLGVCNVALIEGKLEQGVPDQAPYSLIIINGAVRDVPQNIIDQMDVCGRLVTIIRGNDQHIGCATLFVKNEYGKVSSRPLFDAASPFLKGFELESEFKF